MAPFRSLHNIASPTSSGTVVRMPPASTARTSVSNQQPARASAEDLLGVSSPAPASGGALEDIFGLSTPPPQPPAASAQSNAASDMMGLFGSMSVSANVPPVSQQLHPPTPQAGNPFDGQATPPAHAVSGYVATPTQVPGLAQSSPQITGTTGMNQQPTYAHTQQYPSAPQAQAARPQQPQQSPSLQPTYAQLTPPHQQVATTQQQQQLNQRHASPAQQMPSQATVPTHFQQQQQHPLPPNQSQAYPHQQVVQPHPHQHQQYPVQYAGAQPAVQLAGTQPVGQHHVYPPSGYQQQQQTPPPPQQQQQQQRPNRSQFDPFA